MLPIRGKSKLSKQAIQLKSFKRGSNTCWSAWITGLLRFKKPGAASRRPKTISHFRLAVPSMAMATKFVTGVNASM